MSRDLEIIARLRDSDNLAMALFLKENTERTEAVLSKKFPNICFTFIQQAIIDGAIRVWMNADKYDPKKGSLAAWFTAISHNCLLDLLRKNKSQPTISTERLKLLAVEETYHRTLSRKNQIMLELVQQEFLNLSPLQREIIKRDLNGQDNEQISEELGKSKNNINSQRCKAIKNLRRSLGGKHE